MPRAQCPSGPGHEVRPALARQPSAKRVESGAGGSQRRLVRVKPEQPYGPSLEPADLLVATVQSEATMLVGQNAE